MTSCQSNSFMKISFILKVKKMKLENFLFLFISDHLHVIFLKRLLAFFVSLFIVIVIHVLYNNPLDKLSGMKLTGGTKLGCTLTASTDSQSTSAMMLSCFKASKLSSLFLGSCWGSCKQWQAFKGESNHSEDTQGSWNYRISCGDQEV